MVILILLSYGALAAALGMLLGNYGRTEAQVIGVIASNLLAGLGGRWWPIEIAPRWAQHVALFRPAGWTMDVLHKLVNFQASPASVIPHLIASLAARRWWRDTSCRAHFDSNDIAAHPVPQRSLRDLWQLLKQF